MRIVIATWFPADTLRPHGGVEAVSVSLVDALARVAGTDVTVVTLDAHVRVPTVTTWNGVSIHRLPRGEKPLLSFVAGTARRGLKDYIINLKPDVVHCHDTFGLMLRDLNAARVFTIHGFIHEDTRIRGTLSHQLRALLWKYYEIGCWSQQPHIISISPYVRERLRGIARGSIHDIENPVARECFHRRSSEEGLTIFSAAVICRRKNTIGLVLAFAEMNIPGAKLRLAGPITEPAYGAELRKTIRECGLAESVELLGAISSQSVRHELSHAAVFALVSLEEGAPMGVAEALAMGVPVVTSNRCGMPYMVRDGETGFLVDPTVPSAVARQLRRLLHSADLRKRIGANGRAHAEFFYHPDRVASRTLEVYRSAIGLSNTLAASELATGSVA